MIVDEFDFKYTTKEKDMVHVYRCMNPINDLVYGYGGVKLFPTYRQEIWIKIQPHT